MKFFYTYVALISGYLIIKNMIKGVIYDVKITPKHSDVQLCENKSY